MKWLGAVVIITIVAVLGWLAIFQAIRPGSGAWWREGGLWITYDGGRRVACYAVAAGLGGQGPDGDAPLSCVWVPLGYDPGDEDVP